MRLSVDDLCEFEQLCFDIKVEERNACAWSVGDAVYKGSPIMVCATELFRPTKPVRYLVYSKTALPNSPAACNPWGLAIIAAPAWFWVADRYDHGDVVQYTLVEAEPLDMLGEPLLLDEAATEHVRDLLVESYMQAPPEYTRDKRYARATHQEGGIASWDPISRFIPDELSRCFGVEVPGERRHIFREGDGTFEPFLEIGDPLDTDARYQLLWDVAEKESNFEGGERYAIYFVGHIKDNHVRIIGKGQTDSIVRCDGLYPKWEWPVNPTRLKMTNKGGLGSGNVTLALEGNKPERQASWVRDTDGSFIVTWPEYAPTGLPTRFDSYREALLSLFVTIVMAGQIGVDDEEDETRQVDCRIFESGGFVRMVASQRQQFGDVALAVAEARMNGERLEGIEESYWMLKAIYEDGRLYPASFRTNLLHDRVWFDPLFNSAVLPVHSSQIEEALSSLKEAYELGISQNPETSVSAGEADWVLGRASAAFAGDHDAQESYANYLANRVSVPWRFQMGISREEGSRELKVNLFMPALEVFPKDPLVGNRRYTSKKPPALTDRVLRDKYATVTAAMSLLAIGIAKRSAPAYNRVKLNTWAPYEKKLRCVVALDAHEDEIDRFNFCSTEAALDVLKGLGAKIHVAKDRSLCDVEPSFPVDEGLDQLIGASRFNGYAALPLMSVFRLIQVLTDWGLWDALEDGLVDTDGSLVSHAFGLAKKIVGADPCDYLGKPVILFGLGAERAILSRNEARRLDWLQMACVAVLETSADTGLRGTVVGLIDIDNVGLPEVYKPEPFEIGCEDLVTCDFVAFEDWIYADDNTWVDSFRVEDADECAPTRCIRGIGHLRCPEDPDKIVAVAAHDGVDPEALWVRLVGLDGQTVLGRVETEPYSDLSVHMGDEVVLSFEEEPMVGQTVAYIR